MKTQAKEPEDVVNEHKAALVLGASVHTLRGWRMRRCGPPYYKIGGQLVRYRKSDLIEYREKSRIEPETDLTRKQTG